MKKFILSLMLFCFPTLVFAYSNEVVLGGENIGIHIDTPGVMVIGFYKVNGENLKGNPEIKVGDYITYVGDTKVLSIDDLTNGITKEIDDGKVTLTVNRDNEIIKVAIDLEKIDGVYKTGLYVKDGITGIGTLSYIDPESKVYGALGHEIIESSSKEIIEVRTGSIFESSITDIRKSSRGSAGEKNADFHYNKVYGDVKVNTNKGIYGIYQKDMSNYLIPVGTKDDVSIGKASIYTVLNGKEKKEYEIEITNIQEYNSIKNITFEITDQKLLDKAGGVVQGMSGSPIVQNGKLIGAVTHVIVDNPKKGYGIFITTMLEQGDKIKN